MRIALISDIHGNTFALNAVLQDAANERVDRYLFLGDYCADIPMPNEVSERLFSLQNADFVRGNKEDYLQGVHDAQSEEWNARQWAIMRWNYQELRPEYLKKYLAMPKQISVPLRSGTLYAAHSAYHFFGNTVADNIRTAQFCAEMKAAPFTHEEFLAHIEKELNAENHRLNPGDVYAFGHTHLQWYANVQGSLLINPGSCGLALDMDGRAAYTIIDDRGDGALPEVIERRVFYPVDDAVDAILHSPSYGDESYIWYSVILLELTSAAEHVDYLLKELNKVSKAPYPDHVWTSVGEAFIKRHGGADAT